MRSASFGRPRKAAWALGAAGLAVAGLASPLLLPAPAATSPTTAAVQRAYDAAASESGKLHVAGLHVLGVKCDPSPSSRYSCEVGFSLPDGDPDRVYLDVASVEPTRAGWKLLAGLCRRVN